MVEFNNIGGASFNPANNNNYGRKKTSANNTFVDLNEFIKDEVTFKNIAKTSPVKFSGTVDPQANLELALVEQLKASNSDIKKDYNETKNSQGWLGKTWDGIRGTIGSSKENDDGSKRKWYDPRKLWSHVCNYDSSSKAVDKDINSNDNKIQKLEQLAKSGNKKEFNKLYKDITGKNASLETLQQGTNVLEDSDIAKNVEDYKSSQENGVDIIADITAGISSFVCYTVAAGALVAAPFTGGSSLVVIPLALGAATATGAAVKVGLKASDAWSGGREYDSLGYDALMGGVNGILAPITAGAGGAAGKAVATRLGLSVAREGVEMGATQAAKSGLAKVLTTFGYRYGGGTALGRASALGAEFAVDGAMSGSLDNTVRHVYKNGWKGAGQAFVQGGIAGFLLAPFIGGGLRGAGRLGGKLGNKANKAITNKVVLPDGTSTVFRQAGDDCHVLSVLNGYMKNPKTARKLADSIETTMDGHYKVRIGDQDVFVNKASLKGKDLAHGAAGVKILEEAYRTLDGNLDGGFAERVAKDFGLNPIRINSITDETLDHIARNSDDYVLSAGAYVDEAGNLVKTPTGQKHLLSVENIDANNKTVTLRDTWDTSKKVTMSYDDFKKTFHSIDGGTTGSNNPFGAAARAANEGKYKAGQVDVDVKADEIHIRENGKESSFLIDGKQIMDDQGNVIEGFHRHTLPSGKKVLIEAQDGQMPVVHTLDKQVSLEDGTTLNFTLKDGKIILDPADLPAGSKVTTGELGNFARGDSIELTVNGQKHQLSLTKKGDIRLDESVPGAYRITDNDKIVKATKTHSTIFKDTGNLNSVKGNDLNIDNRAAHNVGILGNHILDARKNLLGINDPVSHIPAYKKTGIAMAKLPQGVDINGYKGLPQGFKILAESADGVTIQSTKDSAMLIRGVKAQDVHDLFHKMQAKGYTFKPHALFRASERLLSAGHSPDQVVDILTRTANHSPMYADSKAINLISGFKTKVFDTQTNSILDTPISIHVDGNGEIVTISKRNHNALNFNDWFKILD